MNKPSSDRQINIQISYKITNYMRPISKIDFVTILSMFRASSGPSSGVISCKLGSWYQLPSVQLITPDDGHRRCPKHGEFPDIIYFG